MNLKKLLKRILVGLFLIVSIIGFSQDKTYNNPIIPGYNPDPSVCRVGDDYYLVTSTFEYFPGVPIYHSKDLVNWKMIGHALHRPEQLDLEGVESTKGIFAPTIRYHKGIYYMITTFVTKRTLDKIKGNFIVTATNPSGPWSMPHWIKGAIGIDPSLFFDDNGKAYYCGHKGAENPEFKSETDIWIQEIDLETFQLKGEKGFLVSRPYFVDPTIIGNASSFEGPHLYKKDGVYYLLISHGGTSLSHAISIWKSNSPLGPWEANPKNPILTHRDDKISGINATGHADVFQAKDGEWWSVFLGVRSHDGVKSALGRETFMAPLDWSGVWPIYNPKGEIGRTAYTHQAPKMFKGIQQSHDFKDDFKGTVLNKEWTMIRTPASKWWDLSSQSGKIKIQLRLDEIDEFKQPSFLGIRVPDQKTETQVLVEFTPENEVECAGLALERGHEAEWTLVKELRNGKYVISAYKDGKTLLGQYELKTKTAVLLKIQLDNFKMSFYVKETNSSWKKILETDASDLGSPAAGRFTGSLVGLYASSRGEISKDKWATFDDFECNIIK